MAFINSNTPITAIPSKRKGSKMSQITGNRISANRASGQQMTNRMHQRRKVSISILHFYCVHVIKYTIGLPVLFNIIRDVEFSR